MLHRSKYIIIDSDFGELPIVFSELFKHSDMKAIQGKIVSAGFCFIDHNGQYSCYGDSVSLGLKSREEDATILNKMLGNSVDE